MVLVGDSRHYCGLCFRSEMGPISLQSWDASIAVPFPQQTENSATHTDAQRRRVRRRLFEKIRSGGPE